jgi:hypothetical protein
MTRRPKDFDPDLRGRFQALRQAEAAGAPDFDALRASAKAHRMPARLGLPLHWKLAWAAFGVFSVAFILVAVLWIHKPTVPSIEEAIAQARELQAWSAPTDSFLTLSDLGSSRAETIAPSTSPVPPDAPATQPTDRPE